jgi:murein DD-endopeptidase MepM/ murein hydrolase activator NlpD
MSRTVALAAAFACAASFGAARAAEADRDQQQALAALHLIVPVEGVRRAELRDTFHERRGDRPHEALDIPAPRGTRVVAAADGRVAKLFRSVPGGLTVYQFDPRERFALYYAHLDRYAEGLREGAIVKRGDLIGFVGSTGNASPDAPHLHFAIFALGPERRWWQGTPLDPLPFLSDARAR